jgi:probable F420-dependent oxidoreductase
MLKVGLAMIGGAAGVDPAVIKLIAPRAEALNFTTLWAPEHVVFIEGQRSQYPYGPMPGTIDLPMLNPFVALAYAAAVTERVRLATGVCLVPEHNPLVLAKEVASLDHLSGGRFMLGVGIGWLVEEFEALGIPWEGRARRTGEYIEAMRQIWSQDRASFEGEFVKFANVISSPKPVSGGNLPILFGGNGTSALRRTAQYGTGWIPLTIDAAEVRQKVDQLHRLMAGYNRSPEEVEVFLISRTRRLNLDDLKRLRDAGVDELVITGWAPRSASEHIKILEELARNIVERAATLD